MACFSAVIGCELAGSRINSQRQQLVGSATVAQPLVVAQGAARTIDRLLHVTRYQSDLQERQSQRIKNAEMPETRIVIGNEALAYWGNLQAIPILNGFNFEPSPSLQSFATYNRTLQQLNQERYLGPDAPRYVLLSLRTIDGRYPPLEDALALRELLLRYEPVLEERRHLLLRFREQAQTRLELVRQGHFALGEALPLDLPAESNFWIELEVLPTLAGRLVSLVYKPARVGLALRWQGGEKAFRAPEPMLRSGFWLSPVLPANAAVMELFEGRRRPVTELSITTPRWTGWRFQTSVAYRLYRVE